MWITARDRHGEANIGAVKISAAAVAPIHYDLSESNATRELPRLVAPSNAAPQATSVDDPRRDGDVIGLGPPVLAPLSKPGTCLSLRVPARRTMTLDERVAAGSVTDAGAASLLEVVRARVPCQNVCVQPAIAAKGVRGA